MAERLLDLFGEPTPLRGVVARAGDPLVLTAEQLDALRKLDAEWV